MIKNIFLNTEFTNLQTATSTNLISIALISEDESHSFYAEVSDRWQIQDCSPYVIQNVLPNLLHKDSLPMTNSYGFIGRLRWDELALELQKWFFMQIADSFHIWSSNPASDWAYFKLIFPNQLPSFVLDKVHVLQIFIPNKSEFMNTKHRTLEYEINAIKPNALKGALGLSRIYRFMNSKNNI